MKAYLIITGALFGLLAALHIWRAIDEWHEFTSNHGFFIGMTSVTALSAALSVWAWCLLRRQSRP